MVSTFLFMFATLVSIHSHRQHKMDVYLGLTGAIPSTIGDWTAVTEIDMSENSFSSDSGLPTTIGNLKECEVLNFLNSSIGGTIPTEVGSMTKLDTLDLSGGTITGVIPSEIGLLGGTLKQLVLFENSMSGESKIVHVMCLCAPVEVFCALDNISDKIVYLIVYV